MTSKLADFCIRVFGVYLGENGSQCVPLPRFMLVTHFRCEIQVVTVEWLQPVNLKLSQLGNDMFLAHD